MSKKYIVSLTEEEQKELKAIISKSKVKAKVLKRGYALLAADTDGEHLCDEQIAQRYQITIRSIEALRKRFVEDGFSIALYGKKRTVFNEKIFDGRVEANLIALRCTDPPAGHVAWTLQLLADNMVRLGHVEHMSYESVRQLLKKK
jgi:hypothetical protein